jgi:hypothetical protein
VLITSYATPVINTVDQTTVDCKMIKRTVTLEEADATVASFNSLVSDIDAIGSAIKAV